MLQLLCSIFYHGKISAPPSACGNLLILYVKAVHGPL